MNNTSEIIFNELNAAEGKIGQIILNRPKALNALSTEMCQFVNQNLDRWKDDDTFKAVMIKSNGGRAFCAGGDILSFYHNRDSMHQHPHPFFWNEYLMNARIYHYPKPYIAFLDGITMGGGCGISLHGSHQIASERLMMAMPETGIGFFPDVGASEFLSRCPGKIGIA